MALCQYQDKQLDRHVMGRHHVCRMGRQPDAHAHEPQVTGMSASLGTMASGTTHINVAQTSCLHDRG